MLFLAALLGLVCCGIGGRLFVKTRSFVGRARQAAGRIVDRNTTATLTSVEAVTYPVVEFTTGEGKTVRFERRLSSWPGSPGIGREVQVLYEEAAPSEAVVDSVVELYGAPLIFFGVGGLWVAGSAVLWLLSAMGVVTPNR